MLNRLFKDVVGLLNLDKDPKRVPVFGESSTFIVAGHPVPKSTKKPPRGKGAWHIVQNDPKYKSLKRTWEYQDIVAGVASDEGFPVFRKDDPLYMFCSFFMKDRVSGDRKNLIAGIEDGLQYGGFIPNDKRVMWGEEVLWYGAKKERAEVTVSIDPRAEDLLFLSCFLGSKSKAKEYQITNHIGG